MESAPPDNNGFNFFLTWGLIEWALTGIASSAVATGIWVWGLGNKIERLSAEVVVLKEETGQLKVEIKTLETSVNERYLETSLSREQLKAELLAKIADLPTRNFIELANNNMITRIDRVVDSRLRGG